MSRKGLVIPAAGALIDTELVEALRDADRSRALGVRIEPLG